MDSIEKIKSWSFEDILKDAQMTMILLKTYSALYLNNLRPSTCQSCMRDYYSKISNLSGNELKEKIKMSEKTHKAKFKKFYSTTAHEHVHPDFLTDAKAISFLKHGILKESDFEKLPEGYEEPIQYPPFNNDEAEPEVEENKAVAVKKKDQITE